MFPEKVKPRMTMKQFWAKLPELPNNEWEAKFENGEIYLNYSRDRTVFTASPVRAVASEKTKTLCLLLNEACAYLGIRPDYGQKIDDAAKNPNTPYKRIRGKLLRVLRLKVKGPKIV